MTADEYLYDTEETNRIRELAMGVLREPPAPFFSHQSLVLRLARIWADHVEPRKLGRVAVAPVDQTGTLGQQPLLPERVAVMGGDGPALHPDGARSAEQG